MINDMIQKEHIPLANANVGQITKKNKKTDWVIRENVTEKELGRFPSNLTDKEVFSILDLMRKFELDAFNAGIDFGKKEYKNVFDPQLAQFKNNMELAKKENERLANILEIEQTKHKK